MHQRSPQDPAAQAAIFVDDGPPHGGKARIPGESHGKLGYGGIGSGLNISDIVNQLVAADRKPADNALNLQQSKAKMQLSSIGTVTSAFDKLKTALTALKATTAFDTRTVTATGKHNQATPTMC